MTILERITSSPAWKGARVEAAELNGRPAWRIFHPSSGAVALVYQEAARVQVRHWNAYDTAIRAVEGLKSRRFPYARPGEWGFNAVETAEAAWRAIDHFKELSGFTLAVPVAPCAAAVAP